MQLKILTLIGWGSHLKQHHFRTLGIDNNDSFRRGLRLNEEVMAGMRSPEGEEPPGVLVGGRSTEKMNDWAIDLFFPRLGAEPPRWQRAIVGAIERLSRVGDRALRLAA
jgi:hypothetical protein